MTAYVLVAGAWLGGWCWQTVASRLRERGHAVYPVTLTGLGERAHLAGPHVNLDTHIADIVNLVEFEDLRDVVLLGHSYGMAPITGAADRIPERIDRLVYLDSGPLPDGAAFIDLSPPDARRHIERQVAEHGDGWRLPMPSWEELTTVYGASLAGLDEDQCRLMRSRAVDHPFGTYTQPLHLSHPNRDALQKVLIACSFSLDQVRHLIEAGHPWFQALAGPEWRLLELPTGHWPMFSVPDELADMLLGLA